MQRETLTWLILMLVTIVLTYALDGGSRATAGLSSTTVNVLILLVAFVKVRIVAYEFMEIRFSPRLMRIVASAWIVITCAILLLLLPTA